MVYKTLAIVGLAILGMVLASCGGAESNDHSPTTTPTSSSTGWEAMRPAIEQGFDVTFRWARSDIPSDNETFVWRQSADLARYDAAFSEELDEGAFSIERGPFGTLVSEGVGIACMWFANEPGATYATCVPAPDALVPGYFAISGLGAAVVDHDLQPRSVAGSSAVCYALRSPGYEAELCLDERTRVPLYVKAEAGDGFTHEFEAISFSAGDPHFRMLDELDTSGNEVSVDVRELELPQVFTQE